MTSIHEHHTDRPRPDDPPPPTGGTTLNVGQRRAAAWPRLEPSVAHRDSQAALVGVVHTVDSIRFIAVAPDESALLRRIASYVAANVRDRRWIADATTVQALLAARDFEGAVREYFSATDTPWDRDWLVIELID
jgi:hypothetical protein